MNFEYDPEQMLIYLSGSDDSRAEKNSASDDSKKEHGKRVQINEYGWEV